MSFRTIAERLQARGQALYETNPSDNTYTLVRFIMFELAKVLRAEREDENDDRCLALTYEFSDGVCVKVSEHNGKHRDATCNAWESPPTPYGALLRILAEHVKEGGAVETLKQQRDKVKADLFSLDIDLKTVIRDRDRWKSRAEELDQLVDKTIKLANDQFERIRSR